jgi:RNA polymerase sigma-70 factor, ECF subfamily
MRRGVDLGEAAAFPSQLSRVAGVVYGAQGMPAEPDPDSQLMLRVKRGDTAAFEALVEKYKQPVINLVARSLRDAGEAEDVAQNVFIQVYKSAERYRATAKFTTWLFTIARNLCLNEIRRRIRHPADSLDEPSAGGGEHREIDLLDRSAPPAGDSAVRDELFSKVDEAIRDLPEAQRTALLLCREEELSYEEIAEVVGCSLSATKSLIHRARETLKARLKPYLLTGKWSGEAARSSGHSPTETLRPPR